MISYLANVPDKIIYAFTVPNRKLFIDENSGYISENASEIRVTNLLKVTATFLLLITTSVSVILNEFSNLGDQNYELIRIYNSKNKSQLKMPLKTLNLYNSYGQFIQNVAFKTNDTLIVLHEFGYKFNSPSFWFPSGKKGDVRFLNCLSWVEFAAIHIQSRQIDKPPHSLRFPYYYVLLCYKLLGYICNMSTKQRSAQN